METWNVEEATQFLGVAPESTYGPIWLLALTKGLRKGELLGLTWEQVDFARGVIVLGRRTKSGKGRDVPINQAVYSAIAPLRAERSTLRTSQ